MLKGFLFQKHDELCRALVLQIAFNSNLFLNIQIFQSDYHYLDISCFCSLKYNVICYKLFKMESVRFPRYNFFLGIGYLDAVTS